ncbi:hypothetical protein D3C85_1284800 [compost metagenome]
MLAWEDSTSRLWAREVRGAASRAKAVMPRAFMRAMVSLLKGLSMPTSTAPARMWSSSPSVGATTFSTRSAPKAAESLPMVAPAAMKASSGMLALTPAPLCTVT